MEKLKIYRKLRRRLRRITGLDQETRNAEGDGAMAIPLAYELVRGTGMVRPIAAVCHIFHEELSGEILSYLKNIRTSTDLYISTDTPEKRMKILNTFQDWELGTVEVRVAENRGRDIAHKLITFADIYGSHDLILFLHSKRSLTAEDGNRWRNFLFQHLAGSREIVDSILEIFARQPKVGAVIAPHWTPIRRFIIWQDTFEIARGISRSMGITIRRSRAIDFPSGSMFWARSSALKPLLALNLKRLDFAEENGQVGNTAAHAIERLFLFCCEKAGFDWVRIALPALQESPAAAAVIRSPAQIDQFVKKYRFGLIRRHSGLFGASRYFSKS